MGVANFGLELWWFLGGKIGDLCSDFAEDVEDLLERGCTAGLSCCFPLSSCLQGDTCWHPLKICQPGMGQQKARQKFGY